MYVDYAWAHMPKHTCGCKSMGKVVNMSKGNLDSMFVYIYIFTCVSVCVYV